MKIKLQKTTEGYYTTLQKNTDLLVQEPVNFLYGDLTYAINGILFEVFKELGPYAREKQYCDLIEKKIRERGIKYQRELRIGDSGNIFDFLIENKLVLEVKAMRFLTSECYDQIKRYLDIGNLQLGILVNFRTKHLQPKRVLNMY